jgi:hypothetical protein
MFLNYRNDFRGAVILALGPALAGDARWTSSTIPTLDNALDLLDAKIRHASANWRLALRDDTVASPLRGVESTPRTDTTSPSLSAFPSPHRPPLRP